ncbi:MAG: hypothetical protein RLZZ518_1006 [Actinomycetota bacterium]
MLVGVSLIVVGLALTAVTVWFWRSARLDNPVLGPLEVMGDKRFVAADPATRKEMLRKARTTVES